MFLSTNPSLQEVRYLLGNVNYSAVAETELMAWAKFLNFTKSEGDKMGAWFRILMRRPHWDNGQRIVDSFTVAATEYKNRTDQGGGRAGRTEIGSSFVALTLQFREL